ncbi:obscurin, partial [Hyalella azteca]|uniref:Obscurin n=1 Tax=Hyalella azteca TaxID=294128 RepID=A0A979FWL1_HYAAZ
TRNGLDVKVGGRVKQMYEDDDTVSLIIKNVQEEPSLKNSLLFVSWLKDNKVLEDKLADRVQQTDEGNRHELKILNCRPEDTGIYTAKASDTDGRSATCSAQLLVQELSEEERTLKLAEKKPFFLVRLRDTTVIETTNLSYVVHVRGDPMPPNVKFYKDGALLAQDARVTLQSDVSQGHYELLIRHVQRADAGVYTCTAINVHGEASCQGIITVMAVQIRVEA